MNINQLIEIYAIDCNNKEQIIELSKTIINIIRDNPYYISSKALEITQKAYIDFCYSYMNNLIIDTNADNFIGEN